MTWLEKIIKWINYNRFTFFVPIIALVIWIVAASCEPIAESPVTPGRFVDAQQLKIEFIQWQKDVEIIQQKFDLAGKDIEAQKEAMAELQTFLTDLAAGNIGDFKSAVIALIAGGGLGAIIDNVRKRGLISGLKIEKKK